jgi:hypothetical protein
VPYNVAVSKQKVVADHAGNLDVFQFPKEMPRLRLFKISRIHIYEKYFMSGNAQWMSGGEHSIKIISLGDAYDNSAPDLQCIYDLRLVWAFEEYERASLESSAGKLGHRLF